MKSVLGAIRSELYRKLCEVRRNLLLWVIGTATLALAAVWARATLFTNDDWANSSTAILCWFTILSIVSAPAGDIATSRRDGTIAYFLSGRRQAGLFASGLAKAIGDMLVSLPLSIAITIVLVALANEPVSISQMVTAVVAGALVGLALAPAAWGLSLLVRAPELLGAGFTIISFIWINSSGGQADAPVVLHWVARLSPAAPLLEGFSVHWLSGWALLALLSLTTGSLALRLVRINGDLILDRS